MSLLRQPYHRTFKPREGGIARTPFVRKASDKRPKRNYAKRLGTAKPEPGSRRAIKAELDRVTSLLVRARDGRCVTCGTTENLECSHFYKRAWVNTRFSLINCNAQCSICNDRHNVDQNAYTAYMVKTYGMDAIAELFELRNRRETPSTDELKFMLSEYRQMLREMQ